MRTLLTRRALPEITDKLRAYFFARIERIPFDTCWHWTGLHSQRGGYGIFDWAGEQYRAHRLSYELHRDPLPLQVNYSIDHLCGVHDCVNPDHLQLVRQRTNVLRGVGPTAENARKAACKRGHPFTPANTWRHMGTDGYMRRVCRECQRLHGRLYARRVKPWIARRARLRLQKEESEK